MIAITIVVGSPSPEEVVPVEADVDSSDAQVTWRGIPLASLLKQLGPPPEQCWPNDMFLTADSTAVIEMSEILQEHPAPGPQLEHA